MTHKTVRRAAKVAAFSAAIGYFVHLIRKVNGKAWPLPWKIEAVAELAVMGVLAVLLFGALLFVWRLTTQQTPAAQHQHGGAA